MYTAVSNYSSLKSLYSMILHRCIEHVGVACGFLKFGVGDRSEKPCNTWINANLSAIKINNHILLDKFTLTIFYSKIIMILAETIILANFDQTTE